jgi:hypothetical protein
MNKKGKEKHSQLKPNGTVAREIELYHKAWPCCSYRELLYVRTALLGTDRPRMTVSQTWSVPRRWMKPQTNGQTQRITYRILTPIG